MSSRRNSRERALQALFAFEGDNGRLTETIGMIDSDESANIYVSAFARELVAGVEQNLKEIDTLISGKSSNWSITRIGKIELAILRIATYELLYREDIPATVSINEAIEIAKKFGTEESPAFVNGILDEIARAINN